MYNVVFRTFGWAGAFLGIRFGLHRKKHFLHGVVEQASISLTLPQASQIYVYDRLLEFSCYL